MEKKNYQEPIVEIVKVDDNDIIITSILDDPFENIPDDWRIK